MDGTAESFERPVVVAAEQGCVVDAGGAAELVLDDVVGLAALWRCVAAGEAAGAIAGGKGEALGFGEAALAAEVELESPAGALHEVVVAGCASVQRWASVVGMMPPWPVVTVPVLSIQSCRSLMSRTVALMPPQVGWSPVRCRVAGR
jgi:hypothetical protein